MLLKVPNQTKLFRCRLEVEAMEEEEVTVVEEAVDIGGRIEEVAIEDHMRAVGDVVEATLHITMSPDTLAVVQVDTILAVTGWKTLIRNHIDQ